MTTESWFCSCFLTNIGCVQPRCGVKSEAGEARFRSRWSPTRVCRLSRLEKIMKWPIGEGENCRKELILWLFLDQRRLCPTTLWYPKWIQWSKVQIWVESQQSLLSQSQGKNLEVIHWRREKTKENNREELILWLFLHQRQPFLTSHRCPKWSQWTLYIPKSSLARVRCCRRRKKIKKWLIREGENMGEN